MPRNERKNARFERTRFAPSPTGFLHPGHLRNALWTWGAAKAFGAKVLFRLEDHDGGRCRGEFAEDAARILERFGLVPDEGGPELRQRTRNGRYEELFADLAARGLAYGCSCSRQEIARRSGGARAPGEELAYDGFCRERRLPPGDGLAWRVRMPDEAVSCRDLLRGTLVQNPARQCGDLVARDRLGFWSYQFCVVADDLDQGVDLVVRGDDLLESCGRQLALRTMMGGDGAVAFLHHALILGPGGEKRSKRDGAVPLRDLLDAGESVESLVGKALGLPPLPVGEALERIAEGISRAWKKPPVRLGGFSVVPRGES